METDPPVVEFERPSLEEVYREHGDRLWRAVFLSCGDRDVASDAVAEAFAQALRRGDEIRSPIAWVTTAAFRIAAGELARRTPHVELEVILGDDALGEAADLVAALRRLPEKQREAVVLRYYLDLSHGEIARMVGSTSAAVAVNVHRGRNRLRELLGDGDDDA